MTKTIKTLLGGSLVLLITFNLFNLLNFLFQFSMARLLTVSQYGILASLFSIIYVLTFFSNSIQTVITKYSSSEEDRGKVKNIIKRALNKATKVSVLLFFLFLVVSLPLSYFLKIPYFLVAFTGLMIFSVFFLPITRGILQGKKKFTSLGTNMIIEASFKLGLGVVFVILGWKVFGAILGVIMASIITFGLSFLPIRKIMWSKDKTADTRGIYGYSGPVFFVLLAILLFYSIDVMFAKAFFSEGVAGAYAIASVLAKTIFMATQPVSKAMFPLSAENKEKNKKTGRIFSISLGILIICMFIALVLFYFFPEFIVNLFSGKDVPEAVSILFYVGIATSMISIANLVLFYKLSVKKTRGFPVLFLFVGIEILLFFLFSENIFEFSMAFIASSAIFLLGSIFFLRD